ncbi:hypothetical protein QO002_001830 [Pararhizobium capsulatum DSM 1112]|uniref:Uncharacterized protein n=1 Tax=Pararhizobium capsulatum DSM 1112 TaxID=1121113 RepID=A0ABU0BN63_9HYPH|nr:hypothetical protein [Pararhizobium capsulatum]MDQ0319692.1 hypothetical protein [Pararhizobium capsulatum DSM 1112]
MKKLLMLIAAAGIAGSAHAQEQGDPFTPQQHYEIGQALIQCSAYFRMGADAARRAGLTQNVTAFEDNERGWKLVGVVMLVDGLTPDRQPHTEEIAKTMSDIKLADLMAKRELHGESFAQISTDQFTQECGPLRELQKAMVRSLRSGR